MLIMNPSNPLPPHLALLFTFLTLLLLFPTPLHAAPPLLPDSLSARATCCLAGNSPCCLALGLTYERCNSARGCASPRYCYVIETSTICTSDSQVCHCRPPTLEYCTSPSQCVAGETCGEPSVGCPRCISQIIFDADPDYLLHESGPCKATSPPPKPTQPAPSSPPPIPTSPPPNPSTPPTPSMRPSRRPPKPSSPPPKPSSPPPSKPSSPPSKPPSPPPAGPSTPPATSSSPPKPSLSSSALPSRRPPQSEGPLPSRSPKPSELPGYSPPVVTTVPVPSVPFSTPEVTTPVDTGPEQTGGPLPSGGLAGDSCSATQPCRSYRKCMQRSNATLPCPSSVTRSGSSEQNGCICLNSKVCACDRDCMDGELCSGVLGRSYCFSPALIQSLKWANRLPCKDGGLTGDDCRSDQECLGSRRCVAGGEASECEIGNILCGPRRPPCTAGIAKCYCDDFTRCQCSTDCRDTEVCTSTTEGRICVSHAVVNRTAYLSAHDCSGGPNGEILVAAVAQPPGEPAQGSPSSSPVTTANSAVCIDARTLKGMSKVFAKDVMALVLCDEEGSCATPAHMVRFHGRPLTMREYCSEVTCVQRKLLVNSPRYARGLRVAAQTTGLEFTAFAARFESKIERRVLALAIRVGL